jgi:hypothetical protein
LELLPYHVFSIHLGMFSEHLSLAGFFSFAIAGFSEHLHKHVFSFHFSMFLSIQQRVLLEHLP